MSSNNLSAAQQARQDFRGAGGRYSEMGHAEAGDVDLDASPAPEPFADVDLEGMGVDEAVERSKVTDPVIAARFARDFPNVSADDRTSHAQASSRKEMMAAWLHANGEEAARQAYDHDAFVTRADDIILDLDPDDFRDEEGVDWLELGERAADVLEMHALFDRERMAAIQRTHDVENRKAS